MGKKVGTSISLYASRGREREYYKTITVPLNPKLAWKALCAGCLALDIDIQKLRGERKRKGGK